MAVPGQVVDLRVVPMDPDDFLVSFQLDTGTDLTVCGRDVYDPPLPFSDASEVFYFLTMQNTPPALIYRELNALDPGWEEKVEARRKAQPDAVRRAAEERDRRARIRAGFRR